MELKKLAPWNWFKKEEEDAGQTVPVARRPSFDSGMAPDHPLVSFHREFDRLLNHLLQGFGRTPLGFEGPPWPTVGQTLLKPTVDIASAEKAYTVTLDVPGVGEDDVQLELVDDTLTISGEKRREKTDRDKNFYCVERSYGTFRRILSLPEDVDRDQIKANFKNGVLTITLPRKVLPKPAVKHIEVKNAA